MSRRLIPVVDLHAGGVDAGGEYIQQEHADRFCRQFTVKATQTSSVSLSAIVSVGITDATLAFTELEIKTAGQVAGIAASVTPIATPTTGLIDSASDPATGDLVEVFGKLSVGVGATTNTGGRITLSADFN